MRSPELRERLCEEEMVCVSRITGGWQATSLMRTSTDDAHSYSFIASTRARAEDAVLDSLGAPTDVDLSPETDAPDDRRHLVSASRAVPMCVRIVRENYTTWGLSREHADALREVIAIAMPAPAPLSVAAEARDG